MTLTIYPSQAYALLSGLFIGKFTNLFSDIVITGLVLYIVTPEIFTEERLDRVKRYCWSWFDRKEGAIEMSEMKHKLLENENLKDRTFDFTKLPKIEIVKSPYPIKN